MSLTEPTSENAQPLLIRKDVTTIDWKDDNHLSEDNMCGFWIFKGNFFQRFANKTSYVILFGIGGSVFAMSYSYFSGTITTIEKRFKIPSRNTGIISIGNDISQLILAAVLSYYAGKAHRPRWIGFGLLTIVAFCLLTALPHFIYGPGEDALKLTLEYGASFERNDTLGQSKHLCKDIGEKCQQEEGNFAAQIILFVAQFISGIGGSLYYTLGTTYMDDNTERSKTPLLLSLSYFMRMIGPTLGYALASFCMKLYIAPSLTPTINEKDPRWLGAWWLGWLVVAVLILIAAVLLAMFPRELPQVAQNKGTSKKKDKKPKIAASFSDMKLTFIRLISNKTFMYNNFASIFYLFGFMPYWIFSPKYIETIYRQSASTSSLVTGTTILAVCAIGVLIPGFIITKYKPSARKMAAWNVIVGFFTFAGILSFAFIGCSGNEQSLAVNIPKEGEETCNSNCNCDYVPFTPVCGQNGLTYISPCHAGCINEYIIGDSKKIYHNCSCIEVDDHPIVKQLTGINVTLDNFAEQGSCPVDCFNEFVMFLSIMCFIQFIGSTGRATNFLVGVRCVPEDDKTAAMGLGMVLMSLFAFMPSPIFFGWLLDSMCLVWGKTCTHKGNCWQYDPEALRYLLNSIASAFILLGTLFDAGVWYYVKDLVIYEEEKESEHKDIELKTSEKS